MTLKKETIAKINKSVEKAREKHPHFASSLVHIVSIAGEEFGEFAKEINERHLLKADAEALDLIAVLVRFLERDC